MSLRITNTTKSSMIVIAKLISCTLLPIALRRIRAQASVHAPILPLPSLRPSRMSTCVTPSNNTTRIMPDTNKMALIIRSWLYTHINRKTAMPEVVNCSALDDKVVLISRLNTRKGGTENNCNRGYSENNTAQITPVKTAIANGRQCHTSNDTSTISASNTTTPCCNKKPASTPSTMPNSVIKQICIR